MTLRNGWTVQRCEGDAGLLCVLDGTRAVGAAEFITFPDDRIRSHAEADLRERVAEFHRGLGALASLLESTPLPET